MHYLMSKHEDGIKEILQYEDTEMEELFSGKERATLASGGVVERKYLGWTHKIVDMALAAEKVIGKF